MLNKLSEIANFADTNNEYQFANNITKLIKQAQFFEALRTLFDPGYSGLDRDSNYWKRLQRGWARGKMDRGIGLLLAINAERTKLNKKIEELIYPLKDFQQQVGAFYEKIHAGSAEIKAENLKNELRSLQESLKSTLKLVASKELRNALKMRERLNIQQLNALEKVKGLDEETKQYLASVLRGEVASLPKQTPISTELSAGEAKQLKSWIKKFNLKKRTFSEGSKTISGWHAFKKFMSLYAVNPVSVIEFFSTNADAQTEGFELFGEEFGEFLRYAQSVIEYDKKLFEGKTEEEAKKESETATPTAIQSQEEIVPVPGLTVEEEKLRREISPELARIREKRKLEKEKELETLKQLQETGKEKQSVSPSASESQTRAFIRQERMMKKSNRQRMLRQIVFNDKLY